MPLLLRRLIRPYSTSTVDQSEMYIFEQFVSEWWDQLGPMKPLHAMNAIRVPFIRDGLLSTCGTMESSNTGQPLKGLGILDVGCGGGILSEPLQRLGATVTGIDAKQSLVKQAKLHAQKENLDVRYICEEIDKHANHHVEYYDAVVASEVLEHVNNQRDFLKSCVRSLKPGGSLFVTTINKTLLAKVSAIYIAEAVLSLLPMGMHHYEKFISPTQLLKILDEDKCKPLLCHGMVYNILTNTWSWTRMKSINYAMHVIKPSNV